MTPDEVIALENRVAAGITWLSENDPDGAFYAWWQAGLTPLSLLPAHPDSDVRDRWKAWYNAKLVYDKLDKKLAYAEERGYRPLDWPIGWRPEGAIRP